MFANKRGWVRVTEAVVAILIMASVLIVLYTSDVPNISYADYVYELQVRILTELANRDDLRNATLYSNENYLRTYFNESIPENFDFNFSICNLNENSCGVSPDVNIEVFVEDKIVSSNLVKYNPKLVRFYVWQKQ